MPGKKKNRTVITEQKVKLTTEQRNSTRNVDDFKEAFTSGKGMQASPFADAKDAAGISQDMRWKRNYSDFARNAKDQGYTFGEQQKKASTIDPEPKKPVKDFGNDMVGQSHQRMYEAEQKREARRNGNLGSIYQTGDRIIDSANRLGEQAGDKIQETGETIRNIGSNIGDKVKKKIKK